MSDTYIHYGSKFYDPRKFDKIENRKDNMWINKPLGGLWGANESSDDWKAFCIDNHYMRRKYNKANSFKFQISESARILRLDSVSDCRDLIKKYGVKHKKTKWKDMDLFNKYVVNYEKIAEDFDVIVYKDDECKLCFPFWDIDCILVLNQHVIRPL